MSLGSQVLEGADAQDHVAEAEVTDGVPPSLDGRIQVRGLFCVERAIEHGAGHVGCDSQTGGCARTCIVELGVCEGECGRGRPDAGSGTDVWSVMG